MSIFFNSPISKLTISNINDTDFNLGTGDFTVEWWQYQTDTNVATYVFAIGVFPNAKLAFELNTSGGINIHLNSYAKNMNKIVESLYKYKWVHWAIVRQSGVVKLYFD